MKIAGCLVLLLAIASVSALCQRKDFDLFSTELNEVQNLWVNLPEDYDSTRAYGVLYVLDADGHFDYMCNYVSYLSKPFAKVIPALIVVGIRSKSSAFRYRNFTPTGANRPDQGGADKFVSFLTTELIPRVNAEFKTTDTRVLAGHSLGGLLALYTMASVPNIFTHVIAASPSLSYADGKLQSLFEQKPLTQINTKFYFSVAENDLANYRTYSDKFKSHLETSGSTLWRYDLIDHTDHYSTCPIAFYNGLISVFQH